MPVIPSVPDPLNVARELRERKDRRRGSIEDRVRHAIAIRDEIRSNITFPAKDELPEVIVRDIARRLEYPEIDDGWLRTGAVAWWQAEYKGLYHSGIELLTGIQSCKIEGKKAKASSSPDGTVDLFVVSRIPFDSIVAVDWESDEMGYGPHFFCWYNQKDGPVAEVRLYERSSSGHFASREDLEYVPRKRSVWQRYRLNRKIKQAQKDFERDNRQWYY